MKNLFFLLVITILLFSCTIEKRRYFKGYHVENGRMGKWENGEVRKSDPSTGSGTGEEGKRGSGEELKRGSAAIVQVLEPEEWKQKQIAACETSETSAANEAPKSQRGDLIIEGEGIRNNIAKNDESKKPQRGDIVIEDDVARGGDVVDVTRVIFGMLSIVSFALALLFFGSAIFAIDSLVMTVLLLIGGGFALAGLVFLVIYALIKRKQSLSGHVVGHVKEGVPKEKKPISFWGVFIPFLIFAGLTVFFAIQLGMETLELAALIGYFGLIMIAFPLALLYLILTIIAVVRRIKKKRSQSDHIPEESSN